MCRKAYRVVAVIGLKGKSDFAGWALVGSYVEVVVLSVWVIPML